MVTNRHVFGNSRLVRLRFNPQENKPAQEFDLELVNADGRQLWYSPSNPSIDIAVTPINTEILRQHGMQYGYFHSDSHVANRKRLIETGATEGDFIYTLGFPMGLTGGDRNYVIARGGIIARIRDSLAGASDEFLIDAAVFPGNSGGPVITKPEAMAIQGTQPSGAAVLIGVVKGYVPYRDVAISAQTGTVRVIFEENSGLTAVIPIDYVEEAIQIHENSLKK